MSHAKNFLLFVTAFCLFYRASSITMQWQILQANAAQALCCNTYAITNELFFCLANSPAQNKLNFFTFDPSGHMQSFTPAQGLGHLEMKPAAVKLAPDSAFPFPGWNLGDIYVPTAGGTITKIVGASQVINPWVSIQGESHMTCEIQFDETGTVLNGDLVVTNLDSVYRVKPDGTYTTIYKGNQLKNYEGIVVVPNNATRYGELAGKIYLPQTGDTSIVATQVGPSPPSSAGAKIARVTPGGVVDFLTVPCHVDTMYIVKKFDQFFAMDAGQIYFASWDNLEKGGFEGEILVQCEFVERGSPTGFYRLFWDFTQNNYAYEAIALGAGAARPPSNSQWEHFCTSRGGASNQLPGGFSFCYWDSLDGQSQLYGSSVIPGKTAAENWDYTGAANVQFPSTGLPAAVPDQMSISIIQDSLNQFYLQVVIGTPSGANPPPTTMDITYSSPSFKDTNMLLRIQDTSDDQYFWDGSQGSFKWTWPNPPSGNKGLVLGPMAHIPAMQTFTITFSIAGINNIALISDKRNKTFVVSGVANFQISRISCTCGNGIIDDGALEQCDNGAANSNASMCCTQECKLQPSTYICQSANPSDPCSVPTYCQSQGLSPSCPVVPPNPNCGNCTPPFIGPLCDHVRCDLLSTCGACNNASFRGACDWCCESQSCVAAGSCKTKMPSTCPTCVAGPSCVHGSCSCGACVCAAGFGGDKCDQTVDCTGNVTSNPKTIDQCGVCGGDGKSCIGCDGTLYGPKYDNCGVCGGNGTSCFNPCKDLTDCASCIENTDCGFCKPSGKCILKSSPSAGGACPQPFATDCLPISQSVLIGATIGGGIIAAIIIGAIAAIVAGIIGGKKGYDAYMKNKNNIHGAQENPMYNDSGRSGRNPMYEKK